MDWINEVLHEVNELEEIMAIENGSDPWAQFDSAEYRQDDDEDLYY